MLSITMVVLQHLFPFSWKPCNISFPFQQDSRDQVPSQVSLSQSVFAAHLVEFEQSHKVQPTDLYMYILDGVPPIHVVSNHVDTDKLTTANGGTFTSSSVSGWGQLPQRLQA